jgi:hypothetical protein
MKCLVLFSGTGSVEKSLLKKMNNLCEIRGLDLDNTFKPFYNVDILEWDYKKVFEKWVPDYIHGSPVCKEFSNIKHGHQRDLDLGKRLMYKTLEIIEYVKTINPILLYTIENPKSNNLRQSGIMEKYNRTTTSYCKYDYPYQKNTDFWFGGFQLKLEPVCRNTKNENDWCNSKKQYGVHRVRLGVSRGSKTHKLSNDNQLPDNEYFRELRKQEKYKGYTDQYFRYRIPESLCDDIVNCVYQKHICNLVEWLKKKVEKNKKK